MNDIKLKDEIFGLPNADKGSWCEKWSEETHGLGVFVHSFKALFSGPPNCGKSTVMINLFLRIQCSGSPFKTVFVIQPSTSKEWDCIDPTAIFDNIPDPQTMVNEDNGKTLLIIDDFDLTKLNRQQQQNMSMLFREIASHCNISVMLSYQSFFDIPTIIRKCANYYCLWKTRNKDEIALISKRCGFDKRVFQKLFREHIREKRDFLVVDKVSPFELRKNLFEVIQYDDYDD